MCGVYYLFDGAAVLYVGASVNVEARISQHRAAHEIDFAGYFVDECPANQLGDRECLAIKIYEPIYNSTMQLHP